MVDALSRGKPCKVGDFVELFAIDREVVYAKVVERREHVCFLRSLQRDLIGDIVVEEVVYVEVVVASGRCRHA